MKHDFTKYVELYKEEIKNGQIPAVYRGILDFISKLRIYLSKEYPLHFMTGGIYQGYMDLSFFTFTPKSLKNLKLKCPIIFNHIDFRFEIWLVGNNRKVQKKYWDIFAGSDWDRYYVPEELGKEFSIVEHVLVENPDFFHAQALMETIESNALQFIGDIEHILLDN